MKGFYQSSFRAATGKKMEILHLKIKINENNFEVGAFKILEKVKPNWKKSEIGFKVWNK
jgi:hypothetical protein